jgi:hypothetical protein
MDFATRQYIGMPDPAPEAQTYTDVGLPELVKAAADATADVVVTESANKATLWRHPNAHPVTLITMVIDQEGNEALEWSSDTLRTTLERKGVTLSNSSWIKLQAVRALFTSPTPWRRWEIFNWTAAGLTGSAPNFEMLEPASVGAAMHAINIMKMIDPQREPEEEVQKFIAALLRDAGATYAPAPLAFAQDELENQQLRCKACGAEHRDDNDIKCVTCGSKELERIPYPHAAVRDQTKGLYEARKKMPLEQAVEGLPHSAAGDAAYALLTAAWWANEQRKALRAQLQALR